MAEFTGQTRRAPLKKWVDKGLEVAAWEGSYGVTVSIRKQYKDKATGAWKTSNSYFGSDLRTLRGLLTEAIEWVAENDVRAREALGPDNFRDAKAAAPAASGHNDVGEGPDDTSF